MKHIYNAPERETLNERADDDSEAKEDAKWDKVDADYSERETENEILDALNSHDE